MNCEFFSDLRCVEKGHRKQKLGYTKNKFENTEQTHRDKIPNVKTQNEVQLTRNDIGNEEKVSL